MKDLTISYLTFFFGFFKATDSELLTSEKSPFSGNVFSTLRLYSSFSETTWVMCASFSERFRRGNVIKAGLCYKSKVMSLQNHIHVASPTPILLYTLTINMLNIHFLSRCVIALSIQTCMDFSAVYTQMYSLLITRYTLKL